MSTVALRARSSRGRTRTRSSSRPLAGGVLWILLFTVLLAGVVAVNVAVLRLNLQLDTVDRERLQLKADIAALRSDVSRAGATARIERLAQHELGLVQPEPETIIFVELPR